MNKEMKIDLLSKLTVDQKPLWGKMTPQHMVEHLFKTYQVSISEIKLDIFSDERKISVLKKLFLGKRPLPKEFINPAIGPDLLPLEFPDLETAILELKKILLRYDIFFSKNPQTKTAHPVFGYLTKEEWDIFHQKHIEHHFTQFGISD
jgi:DNA-directed RNA polymerase subunit H (RpoH/RPB5)